jgi:hypothetical protein
MHPRMELPYVLRTEFFVEQIGILTVQCASTFSNYLELPVL